VRVLMLVTYPGIEGPLPKHVPLLVDALRGLGCDVETAYWSRHSDREPVYRKVTGRIGDLAHVFQMLRRGSFYLMLVTTAHDPMGLARDVPLVLITKGVCRHCIVKFHGSRSDLLAAPGHVLLKAASRVLVASCDGALVLSQEEKDEWAAFYPSGRFEVVANAFSPGLLGAPDDLGAVRSDGPASGGRYRGTVPTLLYVGRLVPEKGVFDLLQAMARVLAATPCRLRIAGDGESAAAMTRMAERFGIADCVEMLGYVTGSGLARCYAEADALVLPSYREGFPTVLLEAMSMGLPIVTTKLRGAPDRLEEGVNALFVSPRRPDELARALERVLSDDRLRTSMAANNLAKVKEFAPEAVAPQYLAIFESVVAK